MIRRTQIFPFLLCVLSLGASFMYAIETDALKLRARDWCEFAHDKGKRFHYARASTIERLEHSIEIGADSLDTTFPLWTKARLRLYREVWESGHPNLKLFAAHCNKVDEGIGRGR